MADVAYCLACRPTPADGCSSHGVTAEYVGRRWQAACRAVAPSLDVCRCCTGPTSNATTYLCKSCAPECPDCSMGGLAEHAAHLAPAVRLSVRECDDGAEIALLRRLRAILGEYPGGNRVVVALLFRDGHVVLAEWRALACLELRLALGWALARHAIGRSKK